MKPVESAGHLVEKFITEGSDIEKRLNHFGISCFNVIGQASRKRRAKQVNWHLMIWGSYDPIESGPSEPQEWELNESSVKGTFWGQFYAENGPYHPPRSQPLHKNVVFLVSRHNGNNYFG